MELIEWQEKAERVYLHVFLRTPDRESARRLCAALGRLGDVGRKEAGGGWQVELCCPDTREYDLQLGRLLDVVDDFNLKNREGEAELVESRLMPRSVSGGQPASVGTFALQDEAREEYGPGEIFLKPGHAFGTGSHPSTRLAVRLLEGLEDGDFPAAVLDVGCGSGILSLVSARLGARRVLGVDICPDAIELARENVSANHLQKRITVQQVPLEEIEGPYDLILANLTVSVLYCLLAEIGRLAAPGGRLIVSGCRGRQIDDVSRRLEEAGWRLEQRTCRERWQALLCRRVS